MHSKDPDNRYLVPGLAAAGLLATGIAGLVFAFWQRESSGLIAAALAFAGLGWLTKH